MEGDAKTVLYQDPPFTSLFQRVTLFRIQYASVRRACTPGLY